MASAQFIGHGQTLLATYGDQELGLWKAKDGESIAKIAMDLMPTCLAVSNDETMAATGSPMNTLTVCDLKKHTVLFKLAHDSTVTAAAFSPDGKQIAMGDVTGTIRFFDVASQQVIRVEHANLGGGVEFFPSPDKRSLLAIGQGSDMLLLNFPGTKAAKFVGHQRVARTLRMITSVCFSPDGKQIASGGADQTVRIWDTTGKQTALLEAKAGPLTSIAFSPDAGRLLAAATATELGLWITGEQQAQRSLRIPGIKTLAFSPDGRELAMGDDRKIQLLSVPTGKMVAELSGGKGGVSQLLFDANAHSLVTFWGDRTLRIWDYPIEAEKPLIP